MAQHLAQKFVQESAGRALKHGQLDQGKMVSTQQKVRASQSSPPTTIDAVSQTELQGNMRLPKCQAVCPTFTPVQHGSNEHTCGRCTQVEALFILVTWIHKEVSNLRSIREPEMEIDYWNCSLPFLRQAQQVEEAHNMEDSLSSLHPAAHSDLMGNGDKFLPGAAGASPQ